jgi:1-acyl-sn-glycerol-3-phosphate acyltransferase
VLVERATRLLRIPATGFAFALLGLGGLCLAVTVFPAIRAATRGESLRIRRTQATINLAFRLYLGILWLLGVMRLDVDGRDRLARVSGALIVANHPTLLDVVLLMALVPDAQCVVKHALWRNRFLGPVVRAAGYIRNDTDAADFIGHCRATLARGNNLIIFPEGTRTVPGQPLRFQRGFANVALSANVDLLPIRIECNPITLTKGLPWYQVPQRRAAFRVSVGERIAVAPFLAHSSRAVGARRLASFLETYFA